ncbi:MAG: hypothetical protein HDT37_03520 [Clostridiales bacterium]|nr:hypothetical protein [Clostridiales bacterium]
MKYCQFCGKQLEDGAQCTCEEAQAAARAAGQIPQPVPPQPQQVPPQQPPQYSQQVPPQQVPPQAPRQPSEMQQKAKAAASGLWSYLKSYFASPAKAVQDSLARQDMMVSTLLTVIRVLALGLAIFGVLHKICSTVVSAINEYSYSRDAVKVSAPLFESLLYGGLIAIIGMALFILVVFVAAKAQKSTLSLGGAWQASANNGVLTTVLLLLAFLLSFVSISMALTFILLAVLSSIIFGALSVQYTCPGSDSGLSWLVYFLGAAVVIFISYKFFPTLLFKAAGGIKMTVGKESMTLGTAMDEAAKSFQNAFNGASFDEIFEQMIESAMRYGF